jgi:hypothetical protein
MLKKLFFVCNLQIIVLGYSVFPWLAFLAKFSKRSSLVRKIVNHGQKSFITLVPGPNFNTRRCQYPQMRASLIVENSARITCGMDKL